MQDLMRNLLLGGGGGFSPQSLFTGGVVGAFYDPSDLSALYQDSAGTTPVTGVEQVVGLMLDKSQGLVLGPELVGNTGGPFTATTGWINTSLSTPATPSVVNGRLRITADVAGSGSDPRVYATITGLTIGKSYKVTYVGSSGTATSCAVAITNTTPAGGVTGGTGANVVGTDVAASFIRIAAATTEYVRVVVNGSTGTDGKYVELSSITVKELAGNHATSTGSARPTLSARVNLLTYSEEFDNGAWVKTAASISANAALAPDGTSSADKLIASAVSSNDHQVRQDVTVLNSTTYTVSCYFKAAEYGFCQLLVTGGFSAAIFINLADGAIVTSSGVASRVDAGNGWWKLTVTGTTTTTTLAVRPQIFSTSSGSAWVGDGTSGIYIWGADLRPANIGVNIPSYQRITAATNYDTNGFPFYLSFGGAQSMSTPANLDLTSTDKVTVYAGVRKLSDAASGLLAEFSADRNTNNGSWTVGYASAASDYGFSSKGTISTTATSASSFSPPITNVLTGLGDISGDSAILRVDGAQVASSTSDQGTGNFGTYPLYIGARNNSSLFFTGYLYSLIIQGAAASATQLASTEAWVNQKTKAY